MGGITNKVKKALLKGMEAFGRSASTIASNAHDKLSEINLETRRREIFSEFPMRALDLWQKGEVFPEPLNGMLSELAEIDEQLSVFRAQKYAKVGEPREHVPEVACEDMPEQQPDAPQDPSSLDDGTVLNESTAAHSEDGLPQEAKAPELNEEVDSMSEPAEDASDTEADSSIKTDSDEDDVEAYFSQQDDAPETAQTPSGESLDEEKDSAPEQ